MYLNASQDLPHVYVHVLTDEIHPAFKLKAKGLFKKELCRVDYTDTIELINDGIRKYGDRYIGTFDSFIFDKPKPIRFISKCSYNELVKIFRWRHEFARDKTNTADYDTAIISGINLSKLSVLKRKLQHVGSELTVMYPSTKNPSDPDFDINKQDKIRFGPPSELIGPDGKPFGDLHQRLVYDYILFSLYFYYWSDDKRVKEEGKSLLIKFIKNHENFTKLPELKIHELNEIINIL